MAGDMLTERNEITKDMRLIGRAIREGWKLPPQILEVLPAQVIGIFVSKESKTRERLAAAKLVMAMHEQNVELEAADEPVEVADDQPLTDLKVTEDNIEFVKAVATQRIARLRHDG